MRPLTIYLFFAGVSVILFFNAIQLNAHPTTKKPRTKEEECLARNSEYLQVFCTYPGQSHPCFTGTLLYKSQPVHLINIEGVAAHLCVYNARMEAARDYCCFTKKCLRFCYEELQSNDEPPTTNRI